jgi:Xaa-Pro aminopeptidase
VKTLSQFKETIDAITLNLKSQSSQIKVAIDKNSCSQKYFELLRNSFGGDDKCIHNLDISPISYLRVIKTPEEIEGMEYALQLESAALISFYA